MSRLILRILFAAFWTPVLGIAQTPAQAPAAQASAVIAPARIAWMSLEQVVLTCDEGKNMVSEIQKFIEEKNAELDAMRKESDNLRNQLNVQGPKLTDEARAELEDQVDTTETKLQRFQQDTQKEIDNRRTRMTSYIGRRMQPIIEKVAKAKSLSAVFFYNTSRDAWVDPSLDITQEIIKVYNQTYAAGAPKAPATPAPATKP
jgi:outer membrane protein